MREPCARTYKSRELAELAEKTVLPLIQKDEISANDNSSHFEDFMKTVNVKKQRATLFLLVNSDDLSHLWKVAWKLKILLKEAWNVVC